MESPPRGASKKRKWNYLKSYNSDWEKEVEFKGWLQAASENEVQEGKGEAKCRLCSVCLRAHKTDLKKHASTAKHQQRCSKLTSPTSNQPTLHGFGVTPISDSKKVIDCRLAVYIALHSSIQSIDHLTDLLKDIGEEHAGPEHNPFKNLRMHRTKCSKVITNVIAPGMLTELVEDVGDSYYSVIADEATDIASTKVMGICIQYYSKARKEMVTDLLGIIEVVECTAKNLHEAFKEYLQAVGLKLQRMRALGTDGAPNMCGINNSLFALLKRDIPDLQLFKCVCHTIDKAAEKAEGCLPEHIIYMIKETHNWFAHSTVKRHAYLNVFQTLNPESKKNPNKIPSLCDTRWLVLYPIVCGMISQYTELGAVFNLRSADGKDHHAKIRLARQGQLPLSIVPERFSTGRLQSESDVSEHSKRRHQVKWGAA